ncbi:MAG: hypothetical protein L0387_40645 [Acidobacteria bacterium]|nr:hypothetical protein [Acidobacteriota bacterium]
MQREVIRPSAGKWGREIAPVLRCWWAVRGSTLLWIGVILMVVAALARLIYAFPQLLWSENPGALI